MMPEDQYHLKARVSSYNLPGIRLALAATLPGASVRPEGTELIVEAEVRGSTAKDLNRSLLSALRRVEKKTRIRSEWTSSNGSVERFFDYVLKGKRSP